VDVTQELRLPDRVDERAEMLAAIDEGIAQLEAGQTLSMKEVEQRLAKWLSR
jgi:predicted transcriptional regulator